MTPICWFQSLFSRSNPLPRRGRKANRLAPSRLDVLEKRVLLSATELVVTTNQDVTSSTDGLITLREALAFAASNPGADTITFGNGSAIAGGTNFTDATADTITLGGTELLINSNVTLDGPGAARLSISGNNASRVFRVDIGVTAEIRDVTITGGNLPNSAGAGIVSNGTLTVSHSTISGNTAGLDGGAIFSLGTLTVSHSTISGNTASGSGGGILCGGTVTVSHSTFSGNTADRDGGGIFSLGTLTVSHSTISGNTAGRDGGGIFNGDGSTTIVNSTLVSNRADSDGNNIGTGGGIWTWNDNVTFTTLRNTILAGNLVGTGTTANDVAEKPLEAASRNNLIGDAGSAGGLHHGTNGNIVGALVADIFETGVLANNGGPTQTIALKAGGPAVNAGDNASVPADTLDLDGDLNTTEPTPFEQRGIGFARINGTAVDIGAVETDETPGLVVTTTQDVVNSHDGLTSLREALAFAASNPGADTITFGNGSATAGGTNFTDATADTITLGGTQLTINSNVTLDGPGAALLSISGNNASRVLSVNAGVTVEIRDVTVTSGRATGNGGGIFSSGTLTVSHSTIAGNTTNNFGGGGIFSLGTLTVSHSTISGNTAGHDGGGIFNGDGSTTIVNSTLVSNRADSDGNNIGTGGGIWTWNDNRTFTTMHNTIVAGNVVGTGTTANDVASKPLEAASRNNLIGHAGSAGGLTHGTNGNIVGALVADIFETGVLANNGGPTQTMAIKLGGPAVNAGDNASVPADTLDLDGDLNTTEPVPFDQRGSGFSRFVGTAVDIGAFEFKETPGLVVTTNQDVLNDTDGLTSLREALAFAANSPGADTITFGNGSTIAGGTNFTDATADTITLNGTQLTINSNLTLDGPGDALLSISGNNASRVFRVNFGVTSEIRDITITGGNSIAGGGIENDGTLTVRQSTISGNTTTGSGGGILSHGTLTVSHSTISGNTAGASGGGIWSYGTLTVSHSTISGNTAGENGGGIINLDRLTTIVNSTLVNNRADSDGNSSGTGGAIWTFNDGATFTTLHNTIVAGNFVGTGTTANDVAEKPLEAASRNNLMGDAGSSGGLTHGTNGNIVGAQVADIFETGVLANNGGPTQTIALKASSPAVNAGDNTSVPADALDLDGDLNTTEPVPVDQRGVGFARIVDPTVDIGAFELPNSAPTAVAATPNPASLVENTSTATRIKVADITITDEGLGTNVLTLSGADAGDFEIDGLELFLKAGTVLNVVAQPTYSVTIEVNDASMGGTPDASFNFTLNITEVPSLVVTTNSDIVDDNDGLTSLREAITFANSNPDASTITFGNGSSVGGTNFTDATADTIVLTGGQMALTTSLTITGNGAANTIIDGGWDGVDNSGVGSRIFLVDDGTTTVQTVTITSLTLRKAYNRPANYQLPGGAIRNLEHLTLSDSVLRDNYGWNGGGVLNFGGTLVSSRNTYTGNQGDQGGAVYNAEGTFVSTGDAFTSNVADVGGAIASFYGSSSTSSTTVINGTIANNIAGTGGGGIFNLNNLTTINVTIANNSAASGAGLFAQNGSVWNARNTILAGNQGEDYYPNGAPVVVSDRLLIGDNTLTGTGITSNVTYAAIFGTNVLANNGGPTQTIALKSGSAAVNAGSNSLAVDDNSQPLTNDQRGTGFPRVIGGIVDIGAFERANSTPTDVTLSSNTIAENAGTNAVIGTLAGVDPDPNDALTLLLPVGLTDNALFNLSGGNLQANASFNFEANSSYTVTVRVTDFEGATFEKTLTISVTDVNEAPTSVSLQNITTTTLAENTNTTTAIKLADIVFADDALGTNVLSLSGPDAALFEISSSNELMIRANAVLDFESKASPEVTVEINDAAVGGAVDASTNFTLTLTNVLDTTADADAFTFAFSSSNVAITHVFNGGSPVLVGTFPLNSPIVLDGLDAKDSVRVVGTANADSFTLSSTDLIVNGTTLTLNGSALRTLAGGLGSDFYRFDADTVLGAWSLDESGGGIDTIDFSATTTVGVSLNMATAGAQLVHPTNLSLSLGSGSTFENVIGGSGADMLIGNSLSNTLTGGAGDDQLVGGAGSDLLFGGANNDSYLFGPASAAEADEVTENVNDGIDTLNFGFLNTSVALHLGANTFQPVHSNRTLKLNSAITFENAIGGTGADNLTGNTLNNTLSGGPGDDRLIGAAGSDVLLGGANSDTYLFGPATVAEADEVTESLGDGIDTLSFVFLTTDVSVHLGSNAVQTVHTNRTLKLSSAMIIENLIGGTGNDTLIGNSQNNTLTGGLGDDRLVGSTGNDVLLGGANNDTYMFGPASAAETDEVTESAVDGVDTLNFEFLTTDVVLNLGTNVVQTVHTNRTLRLNSASTFENAVGGKANDTLLGNALSNRLTDGVGDNVLVGLDGGDTLETGSGRDILVGGTGLDTLNGGVGDDIVIAGRTTSDTNPTNLATLRTAWISADPYETRITNLRAGVGSPVVSLKTTIDVLNDAGEDDVLTGGPGTDWFFRALDDVITDLAAGELIDVL